MKHPDHIVGKAISLRPAIISDKRQIYEALAHSELTDILLGNFAPDSTLLLSYEEFCDDYKAYYFDDSSPELGRCFVIEADGQAVGQVNHNKIESDRNRTELDIWMFSEELCGNGYGSEALRLLCDYMRSELKVDGFYIKPSKSNPRAIRAYQKAGFFLTKLADEEAEVEYGSTLDSIDSVYMTRNIEPVASDARPVRVV